MTPGDQVLAGGILAVVSLLGALVLDCLERDFRAKKARRVGPKPTKQG